MTLSEEADIWVVGGAKRFEGLSSLLEMSFTCRYLPLSLLSKIKLLKVKQLSKLTHVFPLSFCRHLLEVKFRAVTLFHLSLAPLASIPVPAPLSLQRCQPQWW